jgi:cell division protease FtsH
VNSTLKSLAFWVALVALGGLAWNFSTKYQAAAKPLSFSEFMASVDAGQVDRVTITGSDITGINKSNENFRTYAPIQYDGLANKLIERGVVVTARQQTDSPWAALLYTWAPILLMIGFWLFFMRQMQSGGNKALSFGKSKAKLSSSTQKKVTFKDVAGVDEAKDELQEIIDFLREPQKFQKLGGRIPKGVLLMGPPGTGKTLLARAVAGEANVPFFSISGSDFVEMFVGVGASRVRDLFEQGKKNAPCIVFIDEIDAVGRHRGAGLGGGHDEREQTLNQLLVEMDGFESNEGVILVAATNRPDVLDPALLRRAASTAASWSTGRTSRVARAFWRSIRRRFRWPTTSTWPYWRARRPASRVPTLANLVNEAALNAARYNQKVVRMHDFEYAKDKVLMGAERRSMLVSEEEKRVTAIHEAGHALLAVKLPHADPIHKVTIIPRGMALGLTQQLPVDEKHNYSRGVPRGSDRHPAGRTHRRGDHQRQHHHRRRQRPRTRHRSVAPHGVRVGHEPDDGSADLRQERRADLPRTRDRAAPGLQRGHGASHRPGSEAVRHRELQQGLRHSDRAQEGPARHGRRVASVGDAGCGAGEADCRRPPGRRARRAAAVGYARTHADPGARRWVDEALVAGAAAAAASRDAGIGPRFRRNPRPPLTT